MANQYDPYREALVIEQRTEWPEQFDHWDPERKEEIARQLHAEPDQAAQLTYERQHTGFTRVITVTEEDLQRLGVSV